MHYPKEKGYYWTVDASGGEQIGYWMPHKQFLMLLGSDPNRNGLDDDIVEWHKISVRPRKEWEKDLD